MTTCSSCGSVAKESDRFCRNCGNDLIDANTKLIRRGRTLVIAAIIINLALEFFSTIYGMLVDSMTGIRNSSWLTVIVRVSFEIALLYLVYRGYSWARWITGLLAFAATVIVLAYTFPMLNDLNIMYLLILGIPIVMTSSMAVLLLIPRSVRAFQQAQREARMKKSTPKLV